jgi:DNA-directed RNA polymerase subunit RPC12/RpoP
VLTITKVRVWFQVSEEPPTAEDNAYAHTQSKEARSSPAGRYRCAQCHQRFRTRDLWSSHMQCHTKRDEREQGTPFRCPLCPFSHESLVTFKRHVKQEHWLHPESPVQQLQEENRLWRSLAQVEVSRTLQDAARESQVPATYAVPQAPPDNFIMQPFLLEEPPDTTAPAASCSDPEPATATTSSTDGTFVPSLVFLPVREKVSGTLTVSFTLTPA